MPSVKSLTMATTSLKHKRKKLFDFFVLNRNNELIPRGLPRKGFKIIPLQPST